MENSIEDIIATREFKRVSDTSSILLIIGKPKQFADSDDFYTPYQILGIGGERVRRVGGVDAVQSLQLALNMIGHDLKVLNEKREKQLIWDGSQDGDLGF